MKSFLTNEVAIRGTRAAIRAVVMVVLMGWLMLWMMMPTSTYKQTWLPLLNSKANTAFFGAQGANLLVFTSPILLVSVMGCLYLHLGNKLNANYTQSGGETRRRLAVWTRPVLVKGPMGIVSGTELGFFVMFVALLVWSFSAYLRVSFAMITPESAAKKGLELWESRLGSAAHRLGMVGNICLAFLFFPVTRGSSVLQLFGLTSEGCIKYHMWLGHMALVILTTHGACYIFYWAITHRISEMISWSKTDVSNVAGELSLACGLVMWLTTFHRIRRKAFELFFYTHYLYIPFVIFYVLHAGIAFFCTTLPGFYLFLIDRYLRFLQSRRRVRLVSARVLPCEAVELNFSKTPGLKFAPASMMFISVPSISKLQWHPFSIASSSGLEPENVSVIIKSGGSWSDRLYRLLSSPSPPDRLEVSIEGPYGPASTNFLRHETLVMVSGGSGITPFVSIIRELIFTSSTLELEAPRVLLICAFKDSAGLAMLDLLLPITSTPCEAPGLQLQIEAYVTRQERPSLDRRLKGVRAIWFSPMSSDAPLSGILGPNSWLWLAMIVSSSFVAFLILLGIVTRYYIYPIDRNSGETYAASARASFSVFLVCVCTSVTASAAFLWNKRKNSVETTRIQNEEALGSAYDDVVGRELESPQNQSFIQANTKVHYGGRPDLRRILIGCKESSVGVLVCGPLALSQEVATICSSNAPKNLHFESISFSW